MNSVYREAARRIMASGTMTWVAVNSVTGERVSDEVEIEKNSSLKITKGCAAKLVFFVNGEQVFWCDAGVVNEGNTVTPPTITFSDE